MLYYGKHLDVRHPSEHLCPGLFPFIQTLTSLSERIILNSLNNHFCKRDLKTLCKKNTLVFGIAYFSLLKTPFVVSIKAGL